MPARAFSRRLTKTFFAPLVAIVLFGTCLLLWRFHAELSAANWVAHTRRVIISAKDAQIDLRSVALNASFAVLLPDPQYRDQYFQAEHDLTGALGDLTNLVADNPAQQRRLLDVSALKGRWTERVQGLMNARLGTLDVGSFREAEDQGRQIEHLLDQVIGEEYQLLDARRAREARESLVTFITAPLLALLTIALIGYSGWRQIREAADQFATALADAEDANRARDNFLATVSHELRNPLSSILLSCRVALSIDSMDERVRRSLSAIERAARAQAQLVEDLLDLSRIETGRMRLDVQMVNLSEVVRAAVETMQPAADAKSIALMQILDPRAGPIAGDPGRLQQVVWNLVSNAVKFTPKGGKVQVRLQRINSHIEIVVADTGAGIEPALLSHVFERFWQVEDQEHRRAGVGLGLTIVRQIVTMHGGSVVAHSDGAGKGATFTVRLPVPVSAEAPSDLRRHPAVSPAPGMAAAPRLDGLSLLVVDDDPDVCDALKNLFASLGARVTAAMSVAEALPLYEQLRPDAVISDIGMPGQDGYALARELRAREHASARGHTPLVALTAYGRVDDKVRILDIGFDSHVVKPVDIAELAATVKSLIVAREVPMPSVASD